MTLLAITYCTQADLERKMGAKAIVAYADHDADGIADTGVIDDAINQATEELDAYLTNRYSQASLQTSPIVTRWATTLASYFLSINRGNPPPESLAAEFTRIMTLLVDVVSTGVYQLPGVSLRSDMRPTLSNLRIDRRYTQSKIRVEKAISSTTPTTSTQHAIEDVPSTFL